ncbi:hypothetical protein [Occallatibacter savannae]|uniref:hypothetical protein n=1 Tax=Occallatibacter savannae TaxID=1002691 RepID=UPI000D688CBF|nr:hypothetical protein [Occallatibacter savannae]
MILLRCRLFLCALAGLLLSTGSAHAHVGNKDIYQTVSAGPYKLFVTVRTPLVIPGVAGIEVRSSGAPVHAITITPLPLTGEASKHPPTPDAMKVSGSDPAFFTGSLWIMASGSWQVRFHIDGSNGPATASVPVPAVPTQTLRMQRPMALMLSVLGCILVLGATGIVMAAVRDARLIPGAPAEDSRRRRAFVAGLVALLFCACSVYLAGKWWKVEAADYRAGMHRNSQLRTTLNGNRLDVFLGDPDPDDPATWRPVQNSQLLADHGHLMHLYAIRWPEMDAVLHLHPVPNSNAGFSETLPSMPPGTYHLYADVVFRNGFPETETASLSIPPALSSAPLGSDDASAAPPAISTTQLGPESKLPDGYIMRWDKPQTLTANTPYNFVFHLLDPHGNPAADMQPYLGMAGHAAFVKTDGTAFAHTHPDGSAAMPAVVLANESSGTSMSVMAGMDGMAASSMSMSTEPLSSTVSFPYGFPSGGTYRIFIQMKHGTRVETGVFDATVN